MDATPSTLSRADVDDARLPPGPRLPSLVQVAQFIHDRLGVLERCAERYGEFFTLRFPWETIVVTWKGTSPCPPWAPCFTH